MRLGDSVSRVLQEIKGHTIGVGDLIEITSLRGSKKTFRLNRASYKITLSTSSLEVTKNEKEIVIPSESQDGTVYDLRLYQGKPWDTYFFSGIDGDFFSQNGVITNLGFLRNNDFIVIGFCQIRFLKKKSHLNQKETNIPEKIIKTDLPILLQGETGTGKTTIAKIIHERSGRSGAFVHLNLSSFSKDLIESEIFGHKKGAFTGALSDKMGAIREANRGTLFLDEIDSISIEMQTKLLTFLDHGEYRQVGGGKEKAETRMIYSSGSDLKSLVRIGKIRLDFYFRLKNSLEMYLPSLRNDKDLLRSTILNIADEHFCTLSQDLINFYLRLDWPGNFRQLRAHLEAKIILSKAKYLKLDNSDLLLGKDNHYFEKAINDNQIVKLSDLKRWYIKHILVLYRGDVKRASRILGISENTVRRSG